MKTNFFSEVAKMLPEGTNLSLSMRMNSDKMIVAVRPQCHGIKDKAFESIKPIVLTHPVELLDEGFFETIGSPLEVFQNHADQIKEFEQSVKKATDKSSAKKQANANKSKEEKDQEKKNAQAQENVKEAHTLFEQEKFSEALARFKKAKELNPNHEKIDELISAAETKVIAPILDKAEAYNKNFNFKESSKLIKQAMEINKDSEEVQAALSQFKDTVGPAIFNQLIPKN